MQFKVLSINYAYSFIRDLINNYYKIASKVGTNQENLYVLEKKLLQQMIVDTIVTVNF